MMKLWCHYYEVSIKSAHSRRSPAIIWNWKIEIWEKDVLLPHVIHLCALFPFVFLHKLCLHTSLLLISLPSISHLIILTMIGNWSLSSCLSCIDWRPNLNFSFTLSLSIMMMLFPRLLSWRYISKPDGSSLKMDRFPDDVRIAIR